MINKGRWICLFFNVIYKLMIVPFDLALFTIDPAGSTLSNRLFTGGLDSPHLLQ
jgi:hypothetical protein